MTVDLPAKSQKRSRQMSKKIKFEESLSELENIVKQLKQKS